MSKIHAVLTENDHSFRPLVRDSPAPSDDTALVSLTPTPTGKFPSSRISNPMRLTPGVLTKEGPAFPRT